MRRAVRVAVGPAVVARRAGREVTDVFVTDARSRDGVPLPFGRAVGGPFAPEDVDVQLAMPRERVVAGRVLDANGRGVRGINVRALARESPNRFFRNVLDPPASRTDAEGGFRIGGLHDEPIELVVIPPAAYAEVTPIEIPVGATSPVEIRLRPADR